MNLSPSSLPQPPAPQLALADLIAATTIFAASLTVVWGPHLKDLPLHLANVLVLLWVVGLLWTLLWLLWMHRHHIGQLAAGVVCGATLAGVGLELILCSGVSLEGRDPIGF